MYQGIKWEWQTVRPLEENEEYANVVEVRRFS